MANRIKKVMKPILDEAYKRGYEQGVLEGYHKKILAYENENVYLKSILKAQHELLPEWIPVTEGLPEVGDRCLCNVKSFAFPGSFYQAILKYDKYGFVEGCIYTDDVTHWMPLPEPPKEE